MDDFDGFDQQEYNDPYDCMPFGDAIRFEENCIANDLDFERNDHEDEDDQDEDDGNEAEQQLREDFGYFGPDSATED